jgi:GntR family transcriptional regulator
MDPTEKLIRKLRINANTKILKVTRIRYVDDLEMSITTSYFPLLKALALREVDMSATSLYAEIEGRLGLQIIKAEENISACLADQKTANLLRINQKSALLKLSRLTIINNNVPVEYMEGFFRPDRYAIYKELFR